jgi:lysozyme
MEPYYEIAKAIIKIHEGFRGKPYKCTQGFNTIGYGRNLDARPLSTNAAEFMLDEDMRDFINKTKDYVWFEKLDDCRKAVIVDMLYNMGTLKPFKKMQSALMKNDYLLAAECMKDSLWYSQVGVRAINDIKIMLNGTTNGVFK